jgi:hypothetical protein
LTSCLVALKAERVDNFPVVVLRIFALEEAIETIPKNATNALASSAGTSWDFCLSIKIEELTTAIGNNNNQPIKNAMGLAKLSARWSSALRTAVPGEPFNQDLGLPPFMESI